MWAEDWYSFWKDKTLVPHQCSRVWVTYTAAEASRKGTEAAAEQRRPPSPVQLLTGRACKRLGPVQRTRLSWWIGSVSSSNLYSRQNHSPFIIKDGRRKREHHVWSSWKPHHWHSYLPAGTKNIRWWCLLERSVCCHTQSLCTCWRGWKNRFLPGE